MSIEDSAEDRLELDLGDDPKPAEDIIVEKSEEKTPADPVEDTLEALKKQLEEARREIEELTRRKTAQPSDETATPTKRPAQIHQSPSITLISMMSAFSSSLIMFFWFEDSSN